MASEKPANSNLPPSKGTALITGGAKRIGRSIVLSLAKKGYDIALHYHSSRSDAEQVGREVKEAGRKYQLFPYDFKNLRGISSFVSKVFEIFPDCSLLINNASIFEGARLMETDEDLFDRHFNVNFKTPFFLSRDFARCCSEGQILNILDARIAGSDIDHFVYTLTKRTLLELTRMAAKELAPHIRVNAVCPGLILPPSREDEHYLDKMGVHIPLQRRGDTGSLTSAISFLIDNRFITGECLFVDGGEHLQ